MHTSGVGHCRYYTQSTEYIHFCRIPRTSGACGSRNPVVEGVQELWKRSR